MLEILVVVAVLAALAGITATYLGPTLGTARGQVAAYNMQAVAKAILRFHQDTGFWPRTGPYAPDPAAEQGSDSPANLEQLFAFPGDVTTDQTQKNAWEPWRWNVNTRRGWNGPYLDGLITPLVKIGATASGSTYPASPETGLLNTHTASAPAALVAVAGVPDEFVAKPQPQPDGEFPAWVSPTDKTTAVPGNGNPLLFFVPVPSSTASFVPPPGCERPCLTCDTPPCLVSAGPDGFFGPNASDKNDDIIFKF